jgi:gamma-glutamylcyclotransferase (GGCT)/AIG2-like uncharacterized protein YtfP
MKGQHNHPLLEDSEFIGFGYTANNYYMCGRLNNEIDEFEEGRQFSYPPRKLLFPYVYTSNELHTYPTSQTKIFGEIYNIDNRIMDTLDMHEGEPIIYKRTVVPVYLNSSVIMANMYILENKDILLDILINKNLFIPIPNGNWKTASSIRI